MEARAGHQRGLLDRLPPATYTRLFGADAHLGALERVVCAAGPPWLVAVESLGGMGKTSLADALCRVLVKRGEVRALAWVTAQEQQLSLGGVLRPVERPALTSDELVQALARQLLAAEPEYAALSQARKEERVHIGHSFQIVHHHQMGRICYLQREDEEAIGHAQQALALLSSDDPERAASHFVLGMAALNQRQWEKAEREHLQALELRRQTGDERAIAWAEQNIGVVLLQQSEYGGVDRLTEAQSRLERAIASLDALPDPYHAGVARNSLGIVRRLQGHLPAAIALFVQAEEAFHITQSLEWQARVHNNLGLVYLNADQPAEAEESFRAGVALYTQLGNDAARLNTQHGIVLALLAQQRFAEAAALCRESLTELDVLRDVPAEYAEKEGWYRASLAKAEAQDGE